MTFTVEEVQVALSKDICKVRDCHGLRMKKNRPHAFCKKHSALRRQMSKEKFKELIGNNKVLVVSGPIQKKERTGKHKKFQALCRLVGVR